MRVLVCGSRRSRDSAHVYRVLDQIHAEKQITMIIEGGATGVDHFAMSWAVDNKVPRRRVDADWDDLSHSDAVIKRGKNGNLYDAMAGPRRNQRMIDEWRPDLVVKFRGNTGTADMARRAAAAGIEIREV